MIVATLRSHGAAPAVRAAEGTLTYADLADRIDGLAAALVERGVGPEDVCAVAVEPGVAAVVAMAAVLRAGAAFLTLDVTLPQARVEAMLRTGGARYLIGSLDFDGTVVPADAVGGPVEFPEADPESLAYISHTSGSTGEPNAVMISRRAMESYVDVIVRDYRLGASTVAVQLAPLGYDASIRDTFAPLLAGGQLVLAPRSALLRPAEFAALIADNGINTILSTTPSFLTFLAQQDRAALRGVELVVTSGESLRPFLAAGDRGVVRTLVNQYGPTECTMTATRFLVPADPETEVDLIGTPIDGMTVWLLDPDLDPVPPGETGEVYLGGVGVARGYRGKPGLTAERFVPVPSGERVYRTGDLARRRPDGTLEFLGRADRQIKIRGYRVDPAEVEGALLTHPAVTGAVVTADADDRGRMFLTAHVTGEPTPAAALRAHLASTLPPYLMPRRFVHLERVPTTRTGKADRTALGASR
ncbi:putative non-ribosomal peptide synthetase [Alloactinosynnema sp. L-07]|uniref:amino acid adenylation domain-containing protein n=1 Tax=Alloactinosynnema sp. L-07 TaxID=1653480 RepID=UPI00065EF5F6|nr:amino acid adenylation domain-containing protein [Alloactinosynnema sp. L-07]CRK57295.1 putative non-ribosomal peptide synthetase [Alloactinosynnema sp. L-07]